VQRIDHNIRPRERQTKSQSALAEIRERRRFALSRQSRRRDPACELTILPVIHVKFRISQSAEGVSVGGAMIVDSIFFVQFIDPNLVRC
jgi:hypothetical protein